MSKVDTLRHAVDYIEKLQNIVREQNIDVNLSTCSGVMDMNEELSEKEDTSESRTELPTSMKSDKTTLPNRTNKPSKTNNRNRNSTRNISQREHQSVRPKPASRSNLPPPLIMLPKSNQQHAQSFSSLHHHSSQSSNSGCSSPSINSPLLNSNNQQIINFNQNTSPNQQSYPPPLTPRTPSNSSGNIIFEKIFTMFRILLSIWFNFKKVLLITFV